LELEYRRARKESPKDERRVREIVFQKLRKRRANMYFEFWP